MALPEPEPGLVIRFNYLWRREQAAGQENARYPRPCAIVLAVRRSAGLTVVMVAPITHASPGATTSAIEIPPKVKQRLGLDAARSWVVVDEVNEFVWPGFDLAPDQNGEVAIGFLPPRLYEQIRRRLIANVRAGGVGRVSR
ncbi:MAG TPA: growth inhibitor PemK [Caulobacteraceae bacterium]|nr:growth inhibitor PemK [Caulobacteraceae bacterium]